MVHRLFGPIVLAGIALGGCQREKMRDDVAAAPGTSPVVPQPQASVAPVVDASAPRDAGPDVVAAADARPKDARRRRAPARSKVRPHDEPLFTPPLLIL